MSTQRYLPSADTFLKTSVAVSLLTVVTGIAGLIGWLFGLPSYTRLVPGTVRITANTAICMVMLGASLWLQLDPQVSRCKRRWAQVLAFLVACIGALSLAEILLGWNLRIDQLLATPTEQEAEGTIRPGLMSPITAFGFLFLGTGTALLDWVTRKGFWLAQALAVLVELASFFALFDFILSPYSHHVGIALQTAIVLCLFSIGLLAARPERGLIRLLLDTAPLWSFADQRFGGRFRSWLLRYGSTVIAVILATLLRIWLSRFDVTAPFLTYVPALLIVSLVAGVGPGLLCVLLSTFCADYFFLSPVHSFGMDTMGDSIALNIFIVTGVAFCLTIGILDLYRLRSQADAKQAETEIRKSETKYRTLLENLAQKILYKDRNCTYISCNENYARDLHIRADEIAGKTDFDFYPKEIAEKYRNDDRRVMESGQTEQLEESYLQDGKLTWVNTVKTPVRDESGAVNGVLVIFWDISDRKDSEEKLREQAALLELAHDAILVRDLNARITFWNKGAHDLFGWDIQEAAGQISHELLKTEFPQTLADIERDVFLRGEWNGELTHVCRDGRRVTVASRWSVQRDTNGTPAGILEINRDITDRRQAEAALKAERQRLESMLDSLPAMICLLTPDYHVAFANYAMRKDFGRAEGRKCHDYLYGRDTPCDFCEAYQVLDTQAPHDWEAKLTTGTIVHVYNVPFKDSDGSPLILEMDIDVTEQRKAEEALRRSETELKQAQRIAHLGSWELDVPTGQVHWTEELYRMLGLNPAGPAVSYEEQSRIFTPESWKLLNTELEKTVQTGIPYELELATVMPDGRRGWMLARGERAKGNDECHVHLRGIALDITERKQAQEELERSEARYRSLVTATAQIVWTTSPSGEVIDMPMWRDYTGMILDQIRGWGWVDSIHPDDRERTRRAWSAAVLSRSSYETDFRLRRKDGEYRYVLARAAPVLETDGTTREWIGTCTDITERKNAEQKLQRVNHALQLLGECTEALMRADDEIAMLQRVCDAAVQVGRYRMAWVGFAEHDEGKTVVPIAEAGFESGYLFRAKVSWADNERGQGPTGIAIRTGKVIVCNDMHTDPKFAPWREEALKRGYCSSIALPLAGDKEVFGALMVYAAEPDAFDAREQRLLEELANNVSYSILALRAQANQKLAELALRESEQKFSTLADLVPQLVWMCTADGLNFYFNQRWFDYTGLSKEESYGRGWNTPFHPEDKQAAWQAWNHATETGDIYTVESRLRAADGSYRWFLMRGIPMRDDAGKIARWFGTCTDIHDMKRAEEELRTFNAELETRVAERTMQLQRRAAELETIFNTVPIGLAMAEDPEARHIRGNPQNERLLGTAAGAELSQTSPTCAPYRVLRDGRECPPEELPMQRAARGASIAGEIIEIVRPDGRGVTLHSSAAPLFDEGGNPRGAVGAFVDITEQKRIENALRASEERLAAVVDTSPVGIWVVDTTGRVTAKNKAADAIWRGDAPLIECVDDYTAYTAWDIETGAQLGPAEYPLARTLRDGLPVSPVELRIRRFDGTDGFIMMSTAPLKNPDGSLAGAVGINVDISARKLAEQALRENEELLRSLTDNSPDAIYVKDRSSRWLMANPAVLRIVGKTAEEALGKTDLDLYSDPAVGRAILENDRRIMENNKTEAFEEIADTPDGRRTYLSVKAPRRDSGGNVVGIVGISRDMTERKRMEEALRESESRFRSMANSVPDLVWTCTPQGAWDYLNSRWVEYTGIPEELQHGNEWLKQVHPEDQERISSAWKMTVEKGEPFDIEFRIRSKAGSYRWFKTRAVAVKDESGQVVKWFGTNTDIEDLRRLQENLASANKELESFNYAVAHDLRAPLRHVRGFSDLLVQEAGSGLNDTARHYLSAIQGGVSRMSDLIEDMLSLSRIGRQDVRKQICGLQPLIKQVIEELQPQIADRKIEWRIAELPFVECDPSLFKQVLANLLSNAVKFTRERDPAVIEVGQIHMAGEPVLFVRDNGVGFDMKYANKLFGIFQRLHRQEDFEGTGVGLAIVQRIMHRHGGRVWAEAALNQGATFFVNLHSAVPEPLQDTATPLAAE